jgi:hypothetical protein
MLQRRLHCCVVALLAPTLLQRLLMLMLLR